MLEWMAWTPITASFFLAIAALLIGMSLLEQVRPTIARRGWLQISTTRGERLFIALLVTGWINILWIAFTGYDQWVALVIGLIVSIIILVRG